VEGLVDSTSDSNFDEKLAGLKAVWSPQFFDYFYLSTRHVLLRNQ